MQTVIDPHASELARDLDASFPQLVRAKQDRLYSGILRLVRHPEDAADVTQETLIRAYQALQRYDSARIRSLAVDPWLWTIALNLCRSRGRSRRPQLVPIFDEITESGHPGVRPAERDAEAGLAADELIRLLRQLNTAQREVIVLHHLGGLTMSEIADVTEAPLGTVKSHCTRGMRRLTVLSKEQP